MDNLINKVAESGIITLDPASYYPTEDIVSFDLKDHLFMGLILKEKEFREALKNIDTAVFSNKIVAVHCSADAIIPVWAYMLVASRLQPVCKKVIMGSPETVKNNLLFENIAAIDNSAYSDKRVVIKGCGDVPVPPEAYLQLTAQLQPVVKSIMYGEPCSTVPVYKKKD